MNSAIRTSKTIFEIFMKRAFYRAQELYDSMQNWLRKLHLKFPSQLIKLWKNWRKKIEWRQFFYTLYHFYWLGHPDSLFIFPLQSYWVRAVKQVAAKHIFNVQNAIFSVDFAWNHKVLVLCRKLLSYGFRKWSYLSK